MPGRHSRRTIGPILAVCCLWAAALTTAARGADRAAGRIALHEHPTLQRMLEANNRLRGQMGLPAHRISARLTQAAQDHAWYMARTGAFSHHANGGPSGRAARYGFRGGMRENIASGQRSVREAFQSWRNSGGHWSSIISRTSHAGFGYAVGRNGATYWVGVYGDDNDAAPTVTVEVLKPVAEAAANGEGSSEASAN